MLDKEIKQQAREIAIESEIQEKSEQVKEIRELGLSQATLDNIPDDAKTILDEALEKELLRREGTLEENEKKYEAAKINVYMDKNGNIEEKMVIASYTYIDGVEHIKLNAFGYDRLPPDIQEAYGKKEDVVDQWIPLDERARILDNAYTDYAFKDNKGYDSWEAYRDGEGYGKKEEVSEKITIERAQDVDEISAPRETPDVEQDDTPKLLK
ncbi:CAP domain-containing protein [Aquimarina algiphila]|uniref:CAP domain-containing protein n=1 Tax=Aquimarina algiphila TaxID=2047982 RepID=A0A554VCH9_9FLAO|nr:CAP domain-containing protein [Aquimarina algiphila]TSE04384.1 CAP domain-containing protein [Aquimarina algiphila]